MRKIRKNDEVEVKVGKSKGHRGIVVRVIKNEWVVVENANMVVRHQKPRSVGGESGRIKKEMPIHISNVALINPTTDEADRVGFKFLDNGTKVRYFKSDGEVVQADLT